MEKTKKIFLISLIIILAAILISYTIFDIDIIKLLDFGKSKIPEFAEIMWHEEYNTDEFIIFRKDGTYSAGNKISGNPSFNSDVCNKYKYYPSIEQIHLECEDNTIWEVLIVEEYDSEKGYLSIKRNDYYYTTYITE